jgi:hypothetical protein
LKISGIGRPPDKAIFLDRLPRIHFQDRDRRREMANLRKWLTSQEVITELDISKLDLLELVEDGKLLAHDPDERDYYLMGIPVRLTKNGFRAIEDCIDSSVQPKTPDKLEKCYFAVTDVKALKSEFHQSQELEKPVLLCKPGTHWKDIKITLISNDTVRIKTPDWGKRFTYSELGLSDKRKGDKQTMLWELLKLFAQNNGFISSNNTEYRPKLVDLTKRLNKHFKNIFGIDESIYVGHYKKEKGYRTKIMFSNQCSIAQPYEDDTHEDDGVMDIFEEAKNIPSAHTAKKESHR